MNYKTINKKLLEKHINEMYNISSDYYIKFKLKNDFSKKSFCHGYLTALNTLIQIYNLKLTKNNLDNKEVIEYI